MSVFNFIEAVLFFWKGQQNVNEVEALRVIREKGFPPEKVRKMDFTKKSLEKILYIGIPFQIFRKLGVRPSLLVGTEYAVLESASRECFKAHELIPFFGFTVRDLLDDGIDLRKIDVKDLKEAGFMPSELKKAGISAKEMKEAGFTRNELEGIFVPWHLSKIFI